MSACGSSIPIICNQENFLLKSNTWKINNTLPGFRIFVKPAVKVNEDFGRPKNGMFIAIPQNLNIDIEDVSPDNWRIQALVLKFPNIKLLLVNSYLPVDLQTQNFDETELIETLTSISKVLVDTDYDYTVWAGDVNADLKRQTKHVTYINSFVQNHSLNVAWENYEIDFTHVHEQNEATYVSVIDHFFWNDALTESVSDCGVLHDPSNMSDHSPVFCKIKVSNLKTNKNLCIQSSSSKPCWKKSSESQKKEYVTVLNNLLSQVYIPASLSSCQNVNCQDSDHIEAIDNLVISTLEAMEDAATVSLELSHVNKISARRTCLPGWSSLVKPFKDEAYFWHQIWNSAGRPLNNELHRIMKKTRNTYHYHIRKCKKSTDIVKRNNLLDACLNGNSDIFKEIKKLRKTTPTVAASIDGNSTEIEEHFRNIYKELYNSTNDQTDLEAVKKKVESDVNPGNLHDVNKVTVQIVREAAKNLRDGKTDPVYNISSDCFIHGPDKLFDILSFIIRSFLIHSYVTGYLLLATLVPIIKDKLSSTNSSKNYRSIAISSLVLKLIDWVIVILFGQKLNLDELQFAYQSGASTTMCTWAVIETVGYFLRNGSEVFTCQTDMSKAFDMLKHSLLFRKLIDVNFSRIFLRMLIYIYSFQFANVRWNNSFSNIFTLTNGVRQGAILSGFLYCFYVNDLFALLRRKKTGCWVNNNFHGMFGYSDDNWVLAPSVSCLQEMLVTIEEYSNQHNLKFSTDPKPEKCKTKCIGFLQKQRQLPDVTLCGNKLPWVQSGVHLGNFFENKYDGMMKDIKVKRANFIAKNCELLQEFHFAHPATKFKIITSFNSHFTGSPTWDLFSNESIKLENSWNVNFRKIYDLPVTAHRYFVESVTGQAHLKTMLMKRFISFLNQISKSTKYLPKQLLNCIKEDTQSITGKNIRNIKISTNIGRYDCLNKSDTNKFDCAPVPNDSKWKVSMVRELTDIKYNVREMQGFNQSEIEAFISYVVTI